MARKTTSQRDPALPPEIRTEGNAFVLPIGVTLAKAIEWLQRALADSETPTKSMHAFPGWHPLDVLLALKRALLAVVGWTPQQSRSIAVPVDADGTTELAPMGRVPLPCESATDAAAGYGLQPMLRRDATGEWICGIDVATRKKHADQYAAVLRETTNQLRTASIYKGKAVRVSWEWLRDERDPSLENDAPKLLKLSTVPSDVLLPEATARLVDAALWTPIRFSDACRRAGIPLRRGVLLEGPYGCGKTLIAAATASVCAAAGWTYVHVHDARDLAPALDFARNYGPAVVFCEDVDRTVPRGRTTEVDDVLNTLDGIASKSAETIVVFTTNDVHALEPAFLRPGRIDTVVHVGPPDARTAGLLALRYGRGMIDPDALPGIGAALAGATPAVIREAIERSKLAAISRLGHEPKEGTIVATDVAGAIEGLRRHQDLVAGIRDDETVLRVARSHAATVRTLASRVAGIGVAVGHAHENGSEP